MVGAGAGLGMGFAVPGMVQQSMSCAIGMSNAESAMDKLKKLKELLDMEAITNEEFQTKKKELMNKM